MTESNYDHRCMGRFSDRLRNGVGNPVAADLGFCTFCGCASGGLTQRNGSFAAGRSCALDCHGFGARCGILIVLLFMLPWVGVPIGIVGLLLLTAYLLGFGRRAATRSGP